MFMRQVPFSLLPSLLALALGSLTGCATSADRSEEASVARKSAAADIRLGPIAAEAVTWQEAIDACKGRGERLPTARDYVDLLRARGITVLEREQVLGEVPKGYYLVDSRNEDGALDAFFMNHDGYRRPSELTAFHKLWTASTPPSHADYAHVFYDEWGGGGGDPREHKKSFRNHFQCVETSGR